jgi:GrpB-like predicted nucleotidyltransferase (UPF0157 family)
MASTPDLPGTGLASDEELQQTFVGTLTPHNAPIELAEYDAEWSRLFAREADRIRTALGATALRVEHVGSTSVPGLVAKTDYRHRACCA